MAIDKIRSILAAIKKVEMSDLESKYWQPDWDIKKKFWVFNKSI